MTKRRECDISDVTLPSRSQYLRPLARFQVPGLDPVWNDPQAVSFGWGDSQGAIILGASRGLLMVGSKLPPPDTREILENPPEKSPRNSQGRLFSKIIAPDCSGAIMKHNLSQGRTTMEGRTTMPKPIIFVTPAQSDIKLESPIISDRKQSPSWPHRVVRP